MASLPDQDVIDLEAPPSPKRCRMAGAATYGTRFNAEWAAQFPFLSKGKIDSVYSFYCSVCKKDVSCRHQGIADVKRHERSGSHTSNAKVLRTHSSLTSMGFVPVGSAIDTQTKRAEVKMAVVIAQHNLPIAIMDHLSPLFRDIFPDSKIAMGFSAARTKTSCIMNMALRPHFEKILTAQMQQNPFALAVDGSNDSDLQKMNPLTVDLELGRVCTRFLDICLTSGTDAGTAAKIFEAMDIALHSRGIPWANCINLSVDNTSVNMGRHNSIRSWALQKNSSIYIMGCPCHIVHNTAQKAGQAFCEVVGFDVEDFLIDLYYYFDKSTKRKSELAEFSEFCDINYRKIVHHVNTRWLSLQAAVDRVLKQYPALRSMFLSKDENLPRFQRLHKVFTDKMAEVYLLFYSHVLQYFVRLNLFLQRDEPIIGTIHEQITKFVTLLMSKFLPLCSFKDKEFSDVDYKNRSIQFLDDRLQIGLITQQQAKSLLNNGDVSPLQVSKFFDGVRAFFEMAVEYSLKNMPLNDELLKAAAFVNSELRLNANPLHAEFFVNRFSSLLPFSSPSDLNKLGEDFVEYQLLKNEDIPDQVWRDALIEPFEEGGNCHHRNDTLWNYLSSLKSGDGYQKFQKLCKIAMLVLLIPHSNADEERVFSMIRKK